MTKVAGTVPLTNKELQEINEKATAIQPKGAIGGNVSFEGNIPVNKEGRQTDLPAFTITYKPVNEKDQYAETRVAVVLWVYLVKKKRIRDMV